MASDAMETSSSGGQDPVRFYCPYPGCKRSFAELWRLKVHYRAPPDIRGSGKERGHGTELTHCPKCNKTLKQGKHHVGCAAGKTAGKGTKRTKTQSTDGAAAYSTRAAHTSSPKLPSHSPAHSPAAQPANAQQLKREGSGSDVLLPPVKLEGHGKGMLTNGFLRQPSAPSPGASDSLDIKQAQNAGLPGLSAQLAQSPFSSLPPKLPDGAIAPAQQSVSELPAFMRPAVGTPDQAGGVPAFMQQVVQQQQQQQPTSMPAFMQPPPASLPQFVQQQPQQQPLSMGSMPAFMQQPSSSHTLNYQQPGALLHAPPATQPFFRHDQLQPPPQQLQPPQPHQQQQPQQQQYMASTSQPSGSAFQQQQHHQQHQHAPVPSMELASVFDDVDHMILMDEQPPSPPPLPPDFPTGMSHALFNFSQFDASHRMPHQPAQLMPMPSVLAPSLAPANGLWAPDTTFEHSSDGDLMQFLFGVPDQPPTMATIHLHHFITDADAEDADAAAPKPPSPPSPPPTLQQPPASRAAGPAASGAGVDGGAGSGVAPLQPQPNHGSGLGAIQSSGFGAGGAMGIVSFGSGPGAANLAAAAAVGPPLDVDDCDLDADWPDLGFVDGMLSVPGTPAPPNAPGEGNGAATPEQRLLPSPSGGLDTVTARMQHIKVEGGNCHLSAAGHLASGTGMQQQAPRHCGDGVEASKSGMDLDPLQGLLYSTCE